MLKMVHAHRLLPLEELLSQPAGSGVSNSGMAVRTPGAVVASKIPETRPSPAVAGSRLPSATPFAPSTGTAATRNTVSPFEADRLRKVRSSEPEMSASAPVEANPPFRPVSSFGSVHASVATISATAIAEAPDEPTLSKSVEQDISIETLRSALVGVLEAHGQDTAAGLLAGGEWKLEGNQISLRLALSEKVIDLSLSVDARRLLTQEASRLCGRAMKLNVSAGGIPQHSPVERINNGNGTGGARQRAAEDPIVNRMQQKFGAEVRTVVDLRQKK